MSKVHTGPHLALVEARRYNGGDGKHVRDSYQASRCPHCNVLLAVGPSWDDHVFFCRGGGV